MTIVTCWNILGCLQMIFPRCQCPCLGTSSKAHAFPACSSSVIMRSALLLTLKTGRKATTCKNMCLFSIPEFDVVLASWPWVTEFIFVLSLSGHKYLEPPANPNYWAYSCTACKCTGNWLYQWIPHKRTEAHKHNKTGTFQDFYKVKFTATFERVN